MIGVNNGVKHKKTLRKHFKVRKLKRGYNGE